MQAGWIFSHKVRHVGGSCCGGCDLTKAAFPPTNPSLSVWTIAQPPRIALLLPPPPLSLSLFHVCHSHTLSLTPSHIHTSCSVIAGIFHSAAGEHCSQLCCQLQYMVGSQRLLVDTPFSSNPLLLAFFFFFFLLQVFSDARAQNQKYMVYCTCFMH